MSLRIFSARSRASRSLNQFTAYLRKPARPRMKKNSVAKNITTCRTNCSAAGVTMVRKPAMIARRVEVEGLVGCVDAKRGLQARSALRADGRKMCSLSAKAAPISGACASSADTGPASMTMATLAAAISTRTRTIAMSQGGMPRRSATLTSGPSVSPTDERAQQRQHQRAREIEQHAEHQHAHHDGGGLRGGAPEIGGVFERRRVARLQRQP